MIHHTGRGFYSPDDTLSADATRYDVDVSLGYAKFCVAENVTTIAAPNVDRFRRVRRHRITSFFNFLFPSLLSLSLCLFLPSSQTRGGSRALT